MEPLGGISGGEWMSLYGNFFSQDDQADNYDDQLIMAADHDNNLLAHEDCAVPNYNLNIMGASNFEAHPLFTNIWPCSTDSTIIHDMPAATYYGRDHVLIFCSPQIVNDQPADTFVTNNVAFCEDRNAGLYLNNEGDDKNDHQWLNINQEVSCNGEESGGSQTTAAHVVPQLKWEQPDHMMITIPNQSNMEDGSLSSGNSKKRTRSTTDDQDERSYKRNVVKSRKNKKVALSENEEETSAGSGEHSDASHEELGRLMASIPSPRPSPKGGAPVLNLNGKARATRGSATDPQSVYARKRREKINERLRILQNLVPNGTKVDISTMLEEAVQYVKFLQLQIKLLSSDDLWMYAPLAYNGMDIGRLAAPRQ